jgi:ABC-type sugar transport system ATPase subunit
MTYLELQGISKSISGKTILERIDFKIEKGEILAITGPPGSGKTTLLKIIGGLVTPTTGKVYLEGRDITKLPPHERSFSMVFEIPPVYPDRTGYENIAFPLKIRRLSEEEIRRKVLSISELLGIRHILNRKPSTFSGGEYQRVALARALVTEPKLLLLDEPFKSLDAKIREAMIAWMKDLQKKIGVTVIYSTHDPLESMSIGDKVLVLLKGVQKQLDQPIELLAKPVDLDVDEFISIPALNIIKGRLEKCAENRLDISLDSTKMSIPRRITQCEEGSEVLVAFRPQDVKFHTTETLGALKGRIITVNYMGRNRLVSLEVNGIVLRAIAEKEARMEIGDTACLTVDPDRVRLYDVKTRKLLS